MRNRWGNTWLWIVVITGCLLAGSVFGYWLRGDVEAYNRDMVAVGEVQPPRAVGIRPGDTLWGIAEEHYPGEHTGRVVDEIRRLNPDLNPGRLRHGQWIDLPRLEEVR